MFWSVMLLKSENLNILKKTLKNVSEAVMQKPFPVEWKKKLKNVSTKVVSQFSYLFVSLNFEMWKDAYENS